MPLTTNQKIAGSNNDWIGSRFFTPMFLVEQNKCTLSTGNRKILLQPKEEMINQRGHSLYFGDESCMLGRKNCSTANKKRQAKKQRSPCTSRQNLYSTTRSQLRGHSDVYETNTVAEWHTHTHAHTHTHTHTHCNRS